MGSTDHDCHAASARIPRQAAARLIVDVNEGWSLAALEAFVPAALEAEATWTATTFISESDPRYRVQADAKGDYIFRLTEQE